jgi:tRNA pseudouridine55 synthase
MRNPISRNDITPEMIQEGMILPVSKYLDWTSFDLVKKIRGLFKLKKAGHAGTLDPKAIGLVIIATEKKTKELDQFINLDKEYEGVMCLGYETVSGDTETGIIKEYDISGITGEQIKQNTKNFLGEIEQLPPMHSAVKVNGKPLYKYARKNKVVERKSRIITISDFEILDISLPDVKFRVSCSKGTYIRSLVTDFSFKLGTGAYLKSLNRTRIGNFMLSDALTVEDLEKIRFSETGNSCLSL